MILYKQSRPNVRSFEALFMCKDIFLSVLHFYGTTNCLDKEEVLDWSIAELS